MTRSPLSMTSRTSFRSLWRKHNVATFCTSITSTSVLPSKAQMARAARFVTMSPLKPSTFNSLQTAEALAEGRGVVGELLA
eukprot:CAMPEP_0170435822 /NCGR_PEP_ID=MMETSP0117_2-20130122/43809_1 /TAXON_ID=400756 /ORGANISM="Durinskia baltica, Strain CSIRO CS-38" /LENGTH=80 /DNA_ID=CAMNT_0010695809 /DNA_START=94 /DNA_END=334 /DNA_ORIENTATION=-